MSDEIERLVAAINEHPDPLHGDRTRAGEALVRHGLAALPRVLPLLEDDQEFTRLRAQRVLEGVTQAWVRERSPARPLTRGDTRAWQQLWRENGAYDWRGSAESRAESVRLWHEWVGKHA